MTRPVEVWVFSRAVALVTDGACKATVAVIVADAVGPLSPVASALVDDWTTKLPVKVEFGVGVNLSPAAPSTAVMKSLLLIGVVPSALKSVPFVMPVIW